MNFFSSYKFVLDPENLKAGPMRVGLIWAVCAQQLMAQISSWQTAEICSAKMKSEPSITEYTDGPNGPNTQVLPKALHRLVQSREASQFKENYSYLFTTAKGRRNKHALGLSLLADLYFLP